MRIALTVTDCKTDAMLDEQFGRSRFFGLYDEESQIWTWIDNLSGHDASSGAGVQAAQSIIDARADVLIANTVGPKAKKALESNGVEVFCTNQVISVIEAYDQWKNTKEKSGGVIR